MNILLAPHNDDEALFASYIIQRNLPITVVVVTDGIIHKEKFNIDPETRRQESRDGCKALGCDVEFLGLSDKALSKSKLKEALKKYSPEIVFAPAKTGGHAQHDAVSDIASEMWGNKVVFYGTYTKTDLSPAPNDVALYPTVEEHAIKIAALTHYQSQLKINRAHFDAVFNKPEYMSYVKKDV